MIDSTKVNVQYGESGPEETFLGGQLIIEKKNKGYS